MTGKIRFPGVENRTVVVGSTGSGKTRFGMWLLSIARWGNIPRVVFDFKGDDLIGKLEAAGYAREISIAGNPPRKPGTYIVRPSPHETEAVEAFLWKCWKQEEIGLYFDEGYMVAKSKALNAILTQGRSKHVPVITLSQRPCWISKFVFTESEYFAVLRLNHKDDKDTVRAFVNTDVMVPPRPYHSLWYDAGSDKAVILAPVPNDETIIMGFRPKNSGRKKRAI